MNVHLSAPRRRWPALIVNLAVAVVVLALAAAAFVFSYSGVHAIVEQAGVSTRLARLYPPTFDAVLVIACVAAVALRGARWWARCYAWLAIIVVAGAVAWADAVHAMSYTLQHRTMEGVVAATPWVLVLLGFSLMLTIFRQSRGQHAATATSPRAPRRTPKHATGEVPRPAGASFEPAADAMRHPELAPSLTPALPTAAMPAAATAPFDVPAGDDHEPTLVIPAVSEAGLIAAVPTAPGEVLDGVTDEAPSDIREDGTAAEPPTVPEPTMSVAEAPATYPGPAAEAPDPGQAPPTVRTFFVADSGRQDYWDATEGHGLEEPGYQPTAPADKDAPTFATAPFAAVPRLNRVRSTPTPPEDDEE
jgi:Protein of unknown function (DUF2637)